MRVISGKYKAKKLLGFDIDGTRPTMDRVKESLFSMIQNNIESKIVLDLYAGSGSLGIEALSNNASKCYFVEKNIKMIEILKKNLENIDNSILIQSDALEFLKKANEKFDLIILDPPYKMNLINKTVKLLIELNLLNENALIICEYEEERLNVDLKIIKEKTYGSKKITIYEYEKEK